MSARLEVQGVSVRYPVRRGVLRRTVGWLPAVDDVSLSVAAGEALGLVGESGCGKTSLARAVLGLVPVAAGKVLYRREPGAPTLDLARAPRALLARERGGVFQDPTQSLNPRLAVGAALAEPLRVHGLARGAEAETRVAAALARVGLPTTLATRFPHELSGGQRQRVAIARALMLEPRLLVLDEALSALDVAVQAQVLEVLARLRAESGLSYLFIAHDLGLVRALCERVAVMDCGRVVEIGPTATVLARPAHPYTRALLAAAPSLDPRDREEPVPPAERPSPLALPGGCPYRTRCALAEERCAAERPELEPVGEGPAHRVACWKAETRGQPGAGAGTTDA